MALASGTTFAGYTIVRLLDFGAMGEVYLAQHPRLPRQELLRVLPATLTANSEFGQRFLREADIVARLYHTNIAEMYDRGEYDGRLWVATEYVAGTNAVQLMAERYPTGMPASEVLAIVAAIAGALDHAHQRGLLHRDVTPASILLTDPAHGEQRILLTDFGLARRYVAPEQSTMGADLDGRVDQYGLAVTAFHLLTGAPPENIHPGGAIGQQLGAAPPKLSDRRPELASLDGVLATALARRPADRFGSCRELADALVARTGGWVAEYRPQAVIDYPDYPGDADTEKAPAGAAGPDTPGERGRKWPWMLLGAASGAVAVLLGVVLVVSIAAERKDDRRPPEAAGPATSRPVPIPASRAPITPEPGQQLDGSYQVDVNREHQTYNDNPDPQPPNVSTWWAFRSRCSPTGCVAAGIMLDNNNHLIASAQGGDRPLVLDFRDGGWQSRPETVLFPCLGPSGAQAKQTTTQVLSLQPQGNGPLHGVMTVTVETDECGQKGAEIVIPAAAGRTGNVPPGVTVPEPPPTR